MASKKIIAWLASSDSGWPVSSARIAGTSRRRSTTRTARRSSNARSPAASGGGLEAMPGEAVAQLAEQPVVVGQVARHVERDAAEVLERPGARLAREPDPRRMGGRAAHHGAADGAPIAAMPGEPHPAGHPALIHTVAGGHEAGAERNREGEHQHGV